MQKSISLGLLSMMALATSGLLGQEGDTVDQNRTPLDTAAAETEAGAIHPPVGNPINRWRYRFDNGQWWYYQPNHEWSYWNGSEWTGYRSQSYRVPSRSQGAPSSNSYPYAYGRRAAATIQRGKNEARAGVLEPIEPREPGTIQGEKNELRRRVIEELSRPPGTIQHEKNDVRG